VQVLQQVEAGAAMYLWQVKGDTYLFVVIIAPEFGLDLLVAQEGEFLFSNFYFLADTGILIELVVITKPVLVQEIIYHAASIATELLIVNDYAIIRTRLATMVTMGFIFDS